MSDKEKIKKLTAALAHAVVCMKYCRRAHKNPQHGPDCGVPAEVFWEELLEEVRVPVKKSRRQK